MLTSCEKCDGWLDVVPEPLDDPEDLEDDLEDEPD